MNLGKLFNTPSKEQKSIISKEVKELLEVAGKEADALNASSRNTAEFRDSKCPNCSGVVIVNKIAQVQGSGSVSGDFLLGFGSVFGSSSVDTYGVNHCNECGNEWKKYDRVYYTKERPITSWYYEIKFNLEGTQYSSYAEVFEKLNRYHAESLYIVFKDNVEYMGLKLKTLRTRFKSIYDGE